MEILDTASSDENRISFTDEELAPVKAALKTKLFNRTESNDVRLAKFKAMIDALCTVFSVPEITLVLDGVFPMPGGQSINVSGRPGYGYFNRETNSIHINDRFSLTTTLSMFGLAMKVHKPDLAQDDMFNMHSFSLSMFKQAAPRMFETAKGSGRLFGTNVPYTDGGRLSSVTGEERTSEDLGETDEDGNPIHPQPTDPPPGAPPTQPPLPGNPRPTQAPDVDPENRVDRGNGLGED